MIFSSRKQAKRVLLIHIGSHKTGTSSLQCALLYAHQNGLLGDRAYAHVPNGTNINRFVKISGSDRSFRSKIDYRAFKQAFPNDGDYIASTENLFWVYSKWQLRKLAWVLRRQFDEIKIVVYLRRQDSLALSHRKQTIMRKGTLDFYSAEVSALPSYRKSLDSYFCYDQKLKIWADIFGAKNITVRKFERDSLFKGDTVADFFHLLGLEEPNWGEDVNKALSRKQLLIGLYLRSKGVQESIIKRTLEKVNDTDKLVPSRAAAQSFLDQFQESNRRLAAWLGDTSNPHYFNTDLSRYPEVGNDDVSEAEIEQWLSALSPAETP